MLGPGGSVTFTDRNDLLEKLDALDQPVPGRHEGRTSFDRERACALRYLRFLSAANLLELPVTLRMAEKGQDPPDFILEGSADRKETFEQTDGSTQELQKRLSAESRSDDGAGKPIPVELHEREAAHRWAEILFEAFRRKAEKLVSGRLSVDHLLLYDVTGVGLFLPLERGAPILRERIEAWYALNKPTHFFRRISVLRDLALLLDLTGDCRILTNQESPYFRAYVIRSSDEEDLKRRLRELDRYCRENAIRHLRLFGSVLGDVETDLRDDSDLDLLVEFEPGARITLLDMARMERELGELIGFKVDLRTAGDLSRYFGSEVMEEAVDWA